MVEQRIPPLTGGCQCGAIRYALYARPEGTHLCHCRMCQKAVGNAFAALAPIRIADFRWTRGTPGIYNSSAIVERGYCRQCGTPLSFKYTDSDWIDVTIGSLDNPGEVPPGQSFGTESLVPWFHEVAALPADTTDRTMEPDRQERMVNLQHPDHDTDDGWEPKGVRPDR